MFIIYVMDLSTKNKMERQGFKFLQKLKINIIGNTKNIFQFFYFRNSYLFLYKPFQKMLNVSPDHFFNYHFYVIKICKTILFCFHMR